MPNQELRTALVLGASGALGGAVARALREKGWRLGLHFFEHPERIPPVNPRSATRNQQSFQGDFRDPSQIENLARNFLAAFGRIDSLIWAAGITRVAPAASLKEKDLREVLAVNLSALLFLLKAFSRQFLRQKSGSVILLSSHAGLSGQAGGSAYAMAQAGVLALMRSLAREWGPSGIRANAVVPSFLPGSTLGQSATPDFVAAVRHRSVLQQVRLPTGGEDPSRGREMSAPPPEEKAAQFVAALAEKGMASGQVFILDSRIEP